MALEPRCGFSLFAGVPGAGLFLSMVAQVDFRSGLSCSKALCVSNNEPPQPKPQPTREDEARQAVQEHIEDQKELIKKLRKEH
ncbi:hypothetical protein [Bradyrhizobium sp. URHA0013]|uniref:hypothetical protein n=1 Tax=Bradyrhizobium sp. URHA0013 TaxID=1380352 RepID=UPI0012DF63C0|nr:hypothetical protein [Bradyrhizobium sp. URHA0013]